MRSPDARGKSGSLPRALLTWFLVFLALELGVRFQEIAKSGPSGFWLSSPEAHHANVPSDNSSLSFLLAPEIDRSGGHGSESAPLKILCIGNSNIWGHLTDEDATLPYQLWKKLKDSGVEAWVVNAGVPGHTAENIRAHLELELARAKYDLVLFTAGWNDLHAAAAAPSRVLAHAAPGPPSGPFGRIGLFRLADAALEHIMPFAVPPDTWNAARLDSMMPEVRRIIKLARKSGASVYAMDLPSGLSDDSGIAEVRAVEKVVYPPVRRFSPRGYRRLFGELLKRYRSVIAEQNVPLLSFGLEYEVPWEEKKFFVLDQCHPTPRGNRLIADKLIARLLADGLIRGQYTIIR
ncbi:MAG: SGNH/GDSL hydrolase family protein [Candidatus Hydrogenedentota bacterium]